MSIRPVFIPTIREADPFVKSIDISFTWFPGFSKEQKQKSIQSLHNEASKEDNTWQILEISIDYLKGGKDFFSTPISVSCVFSSSVFDRFSSTSTSLCVRLFCSICFVLLSMSMEP